MTFESWAPSHRLVLLTFELSACKGLSWFDVHFAQKCNRNTFFAVVSLAHQELLSGGANQSKFCNCFYTHRVRADSCLPHISLFWAQVRNLHPQPRRQRFYITCQPEERERPMDGKRIKQEGT